MFESMAGSMDLHVDNQTVCFKAGVSIDSVEIGECFTCLEQFLVGNGSMESQALEYGEQNCSSCLENLFEDCSRIVAERNRDYTHAMIPVIVFMLLLMLVGLFGNLAVMVVYYHKHDRTTDNTFMAALATVDFLSCLVLHPYVISKFFYFYNPTILTCKIFEFLIHASLSIQSLTLMGVAVKRHFSITRPFKSIQMNAYSIYFIPISIVIGVLGSVPISIFYGKKTVWLGRVKTHVCHYSDLYDGTLDQAIYSSVAMGIIASILVVLITLYSHIAYKISKRRRLVGPEVDAESKRQTTSSVAAIAASNRGDGQGAVSSSMDRLQIPSRSNKTQNNKTADGNTVPAEGAPTENPPTAHAATVDTAWPPPAKASTSKACETSAGDGSGEPSSSGAAPKKGLRGSKVLFIVTAVFFLSWLPFWVLRIRAAIYPSDWGSENKTLFLTFLNHLFYINNAVNPIIYAFINSKFLEECKMTKKRVCSNIRYKCC